MCPKLEYILSLSWDTIEAAPPECGTGWYQTAAGTGSFKNQCRRKKKKKTQPQMQPFPFSLSLCSSSPGLLLHCASPRTYLLSRWPAFHCLLLHFVIVSPRTAPRPRFCSAAEDGQAHIDSGRSRAVPWTCGLDTCKRATHERQVILRPATHHLVPTNLI